MCRVGVHKDSLCIYLPWVRKCSREYVCFKCVRVVYPEAVCVGVTMCHWALFTYIPSVCVKVIWVIHKAIPEFMEAVVVLKVRCVCVCVDRVSVGEVQKKVQRCSYKA